MRCIMIPGWVAGAAGLAVFAGMAGCGDKGKTPPPAGPKGDAGSKGAVKSAGKDSAVEKGSAVEEPHQYDQRTDAESEAPEVTALLGKFGLKYSGYEGKLHGKTTRLTGLEIEKPLSDADAAVLAKSTVLQRLYFKEDAEVPPAALKALAGVATLKELGFGGKTINDDVLKAASEIKSLEQITVYGFGEAGDDGLRALAKLPKLRTLLVSRRFGDCKVTGAGFDAFAGAKELRYLKIEFKLGEGTGALLAAIPALDELDLSFAKVPAKELGAIVAKRVPDRFRIPEEAFDDDLLAALLAKGWLPCHDLGRPESADSKIYLYFSKSKITDKAIGLLAKFPNLNTLHLDETAVTDAGIRQLAAFKNLSWLKLNGCKADGSGLTALAGTAIKELALRDLTLSEDAFKGCAGLKSLKELNAYGAKMQPAWLSHLAGHPTLEKLVVGALDDAAVEHLLKIPNLKTVEARYAELTDAGFAKLAAKPGLESLETDGSKVTPAAKTKAKSDNPSLRVD